MRGAVEKNNEQENCQLKRMTSLQDQMRKARSKNKTRIASPTYKPLGAKRASPSLSHELNWQDIVAPPGDRVKVDINKELDF